MSGENPFLERGHEPPGLDLVFVILPGPIDPEAREQRFGAPLDAELRLAGLGLVSGGGTMVSEDEEGTILFAGVDVDTSDVAGARQLLREHLPELGCPDGTRLEFGGLQDRFDGARWHLAEPRDEEV